MSMTDFAAAYGAIYDPFMLTTLNPDCLNASRTALVHSLSAKNVSSTLLPDVLQKSMSSSSKTMSTKTAGLNCSKSMLHSLPRSLHLTIAAMGPLQNAMYLPSD